MYFFKKDFTMEEKLIMSCDINVKSIGITILKYDGNDFGDILEMTHISPKSHHFKNQIEALCFKKAAFENYIKQEFSGLKIDRVIFEEPRISSVNDEKISMLLKFNGMLSSSIYEIFKVPVETITSYDARKYAFPELMGVRKYDRDGKPFGYEKIKHDIENNKFVLFGSYDWEVEKKHIIQQKVLDIFPDMKWVCKKDGELKNENFYAVDSYVAAIGYLNKEKYGKLDMKTENFVEKETDDSIVFEYDVSYWDKISHRKTYIQKEEA